MIHWHCTPHPDGTCTLEATWRRATFRMYALRSRECVVSAIARVTWYVQELQP